MTATKKLSENSLRYVSGGSSGETSDDSKFLNVLLHGRPGQCDRYGQFRIRMQAHDDEIKDAWKAVGVDVTIHSGNAFTAGPPNVYKIKGKVVSQYDAMEHAMKVVGKQLKTSDWNW